MANTNTEKGTLLTPVFTDAEIKEMHKDCNWCQNGWKLSPITNYPMAHVQDFSQDKKGVA